MTKKMMKMPEMFVSTNYKEVFFDTDMVAEFEKGYQ